MHQPPLPRKELVLVGGGHAHVQVLRSFMMDPRSDARITVVLDRPQAIYSGMVPGFVAGDYGISELTIDVVPLARRAGARVVLSPATSIDPGRRLVHVAGRPPVPYDLASINVGSTVRDGAVPGVPEHALLTRPIGAFVHRLEARLTTFAGDAPTVCIVGGGAAGVELAFTLQRRLQTMGARPRITLIDAHPEPMADASRATRALIARAAAERGITVLGGRRAVRVEASALHLDDGTRQRSDLTVWVTGAAAPPLLAASALPKDDAGFVLVGPTLQVPGWDDLFAVGDCAALPHAPWVRKAGVFAVREGPTLIHNLRARLDAAPLRSYQPQREFLTLLNLGGGEAIGSRSGFSRRGRWVWRLKDRVDRRFMRRFQVLDAQGRPAATFPPMAPMEPIACGGCAAKVGQDVLERALAALPPRPADPSVLLGLDTPDDAAAVTSPSGDLVVATVDSFTAFTDDDWLVGRVAAVNAVSDVLAKGVRPTHALALIGVPEGPPRRVEAALLDAMTGVRAALDPLGISLIGGHTTTADRLTVGLTVLAVARSDQRLVRADGMHPGDHLLLTKALGTGVAFHADMSGRLGGPDLQAAIDSMLADNGRAAAVAHRLASACTDVSGFGLLAHLGELCRASGCGARLELDALPALPGVLGLLSQGLRSTFHPANERAASPLLSDEAAARRHPAGPLLFDPQTSGGLLMAVPPAALAEALSALSAAAVPVVEIGRATQTAGVSLG